MFKTILLLLFSSSAYAGYIKGTVAETEQGFDFWVSVNSDFLGETIKTNFSDPNGLPSIDKCEVGKLEFDYVLQDFYFRGSCLKKRNSEIKKMQEDNGIPSTP